MSSTDATTDEKLAIIASLLPQQDLLDVDALLEALVNAKGDPQRAASSLRKRKSQPMRTKRQRNSLDQWLQSPTLKSPRLLEPGASSGSNSRRREASAPISPSPVKTQTRKLVPLTAVLRPPPPSAPTVARVAPLALSTPALVAQHTPCTLHLDILSPELACQLFHVMLRESEEWSRNSWFLFDRLVESPHKTSFYACQRDGVNGDASWQEAAQFWYNGRPTPPPRVFLSEMERACEIIEKVVCEQMAMRPRFPLEWAGRGSEGQLWRANVAAANCYAGSQESVGPHSDQATYIGPYATIASLSLGTSRIFRLREVIPKSEAGRRHARTFNIPLPHNSLIIMHASTQEYFKHSVPPQPVIDLFRPLFPAEPGGERVPSSSRINVTFRFYRPDFRPSSIPRCKCDVPTILRPDMKNRAETGREREREMKYWWCCYAAAQNDGKGCDFWQTMDARAEGRGPFIGQAAHDTTKELGRQCG